MARENLTRGQIVAATVELLDEGGVDGFSIRRLGARLGAGATTVYWHVSSKENLILLAGDEVFGELDLLPLSGGDWREPMAAYARSLRETILRHPWLPTVTTTMPVYGRRLVTVTRHLRSVGRAAGIADADWNEAIVVVHSYVQGYAGSEAAWSTTVRRSGRSEEQLMDEWVANLRTRGDGVREQIEEVAEAAQDVEARRTGLERSFEYGLQTILDGLTARLEVGGRADV